MSSSKQQQQQQQQQPSSTNPDKRMKGANDAYQKITCFIERGTNYFYDLPGGDYTINFNQVHAIYDNFMMNINLPLFSKNMKVNLSSDPTIPHSYTISMAFHTDDEEIDLTPSTFSLRAFTDDRSHISHLMCAYRTANEREFIYHLPGDSRHFINYLKITGIRTSSRAKIHNVLKIPIYRENWVQPVHILTLYFKESWTSENIEFYRFSISTLNAAIGEVEKEEEKQPPLCDNIKRSYINLVNIMANGMCLTKYEQKEVGTHLLKVCYEMKDRIDYFENLIKNYYNVLRKEEAEKIDQLNERNKQLDGSPPSAEAAAAAAESSDNYNGISSILPDDCIRKINFPYGESEFLEIAKKLLSSETKVKRPSNELLIEW